ncbi:MAG TPA: hypothetical protein VFG20_05690 [Planctomycetaceae bacterium]|nr:hypothetical protein [Planctomycetaceae bacterium]
MRTFPANISVAELEKQLLARKGQLEELLQRKSALQAQLIEIDQEIAVMRGSQAASAYSAAARGRLANEKSLREYVTDILSRSKRGMSLADLSVKVLAAGYRTESNNFRNVLYQCLYNTKDVYHDEKSGTYRLRTANTTNVR